MQLTLTLLPLNPSAHVDRMSLIKAARNIPTTPLLLFTQLQQGIKRTEIIRKQQNRALVA
jgi:hypothetical protein